MSEESSQPAKSSSLGSLFKICMLVAVAAGGWLLDQKPAKEPVSLAARAARVAAFKHRIVAMHCLSGDEFPVFERQSVEQEFANARDDLDLETITQDDIRDQKVLLDALGRAYDHSAFRDEVEAFLGSEKHSFEEIMKFNRHFNDYMENSKHHFHTIDIDDFTDYQTEIRALLDQQTSMCVQGIYHTATPQEGMEALMDDQAAVTNDEALTVEQIENAPGFPISKSAQRPAVSTHDQQ